MSVDMEFDELTFIAASATTVFTFSLILLGWFMIVQLRRLDTILILSTSSYFNNASQVQYFESLRENNIIY